MGIFYDKMLDARRAVHDTMSRPALCSMDFSLAESDPDYVAPLPITVRVHDKFLKLGDLAGTNFHYAEVEDNSPRMIFLVSEITPVRGLYVSLLPGVAYQVDHVEPQDNITITAKVVRLTPADAAGFPVPGAS